MADTQRRAAWRAMRLRNFRSFEDTKTLHFPPITVLFGRNSSGKTSLLWAPLLLSTIITEQTATGEVPLAGPDFDFGSYRELVYEGELRRNVRMEFELEPQMTARYPRYAIEALGPFRDMADIFRCAIELHWNAPYARTQVECITFSSVGKKKVELIFSRKGPGSVHIEVPSLGVSSRVNDVPELSLRSLRFISFEEELEEHGIDLDWLVTIFTNGLNQAAGSVIHIGPLRDMPERAYRIEQAVSPRGTSLGTLGIMRRERSIARAVTSALQTIGLATEVEVIGPAPGYFGVMITEPESGRKRNLTDVGFGVSQVLPILVTLATASPGSLVLIQQPELHLHPDAQGGLADALIRLAQQRHLSLVIESHSEHILLRLQRRIAAREVESSDVAIYVTDRGRVLSAPINAVGKLDSTSLPSGFFEEEWADAVELAKAAAKSLQK